MASDFELLDAWRDGEASAGNELFERYLEPLYRFFAHKAHDGDPEELIQRTLTACVEHRDRFRKQASFRTYLFTIARHELYAWWRARKRDERLDFAVSSLEDLGPSPSTLIAKNREQRLLLEALRRIPLDLQIAIELHYWEGLTTAALADVLEIPEGTVKSRLRRAREALHERLSELTDSPDILQSTLDSLGTWAAAVRASVDES